MYSAFVHWKTALTGRLFGAVSERLKEMVSKTIELARVPGVRIPPAPNTVGEYWRDDRAAEGARLEVVCTRKGTEGSNPSLSVKWRIIRWQKQFIPINKGKTVYSL